MTSTSFMYLIIISVIYATTNTDCNESQGKVGGHDDGKMD